MQWINGFHLRNLRGDLYGGLTAAVVALPLALAFGVSSGAGPIAGLYGAIFVGLFAALFGGTPAQVSGPTGPMTVVMAGIFTQYTALDPVQGPALAFTVVMMAGALQILLGVLRVGRYINYVPQPVISGFMSGIGVIIILLQLRPLLGHESANGPVAALTALPAALSDIHFATLAVGLLALGIVYLTPARIGRLLPTPLIALLVGTLLVMLLPEGVSVLGEIPSGLPQPVLPTIDLTLLPEMLKSALVLALLGTIDSLLTSLVADNITRTQHKSDRELIGQGIGNAVAGLFGGLPGAGATMRTVVNVRAGGQTPISGALHALVLLVIVLGLGGAASHIPHVVLAGILIKVGTDIVDWDYLKRLRHTPRAGVVIMLSVFVITVFVDLISAVAVGMGMASLVFLKRQTDQQLASIRTIRDADEEAPLTTEERRLLGELDGRVLLFHLGGPMSFGAAKGMVHQLAECDDYELLLLDLSDMPSIDSTAARALEDMILGAQAVGRAVVVAGARPQVEGFLRNLGVFKALDADNQQPSRLAGLARAAALLG